MNEGAAEFLPLKIVTERRQELGFKEVNLDQLRSQATLTTHPDLAAKAQKELLKYWDVHSERSGDNAQPVRVDSILAPYSQKIGILISNTIAFQLTEGCNGGCPGCCFGPKGGIDKKFSLESTKHFLQQYIPEDEKDLLPYFNSDFFDHPDALEIHKMRPNLPISTAVPRGGVDRFVAFVTYLGNQLYKKMQAGEQPQIKASLRISLTPQNIQRVEAALKEVIKSVPASVIPALSTIFQYNDLVKEHQPYNLGAFMKRAAPADFFGSVSCNDGVVITPEGVFGVAITYPTPANPSGYKMWRINPDQVEGTTPKEYHDPFIENIIQTAFDPVLHEMEFAKAAKKLLLPDIENSSGGEITLDKREQANLKLGRATERISRFIKTIKYYESVLNLGDMNVLFNAFKDIFANHWDLFTSELENNGYGEEGELLSSVYQLRLKQLELLRELVLNDYLHDAAEMAEHMVAGDKY